MQLCTRECSHAALNILITMCAQEEMDAETEEKRHSRLDFFLSFFPCKMLHACNYSQLHHSVRYSSAFLIKFKEEKKTRLNH